MINKLIKLSLYLVIFAILSINVETNLFSQMPDWNTVVDKDGNRYYVDRNGKIWTTGKPEFDFKPVSVEGLDYYINHGVELIKRHYPVEGLTILKSIMAMPVNNQKIYNAQIIASKGINNLIKRHGYRFKVMNEKASILLYRNKDTITLVEETMRYSLRFTCEIKIIRRKIRKKINYCYHGLSLGIVSQKKEKNKNQDNLQYNAIMAIEGEKFISKIPSVDILIKNWQVNSGKDTFRRKIVHSGETKKIYEFETRQEYNYKGYEGYYIKNKFGYFIRLITSERQFNENKDKYFLIFKNFQYN